VPLDQREAAFALITHDGSIVIESLEDDGNHPFRFAVMTSDKKTIDSEESVVGNEYLQWEDELEDLYVEARRSALGYDKVIAAITRDLGLELSLPEESSSATEDEAV
jgi:hypothetical protein